MSFLYDRLRRFSSAVRVGVGLAVMVSVSSAATAQTITQPAARVDVPAAREFATERYQDPINMGEYTDLGWFT